MARPPSAIFLLRLFAVMFLGAWHTNAFNANACRLRQVYAHLIDAK